MSVFVPNESVGEGTFESACLQLCPLLWPVSHLKVVIKVHFVGLSSENDPHHLTFVNKTLSAVCPLLSAGFCSL